MNTIRKANNKKNKAKARKNKRNVSTNHTTNNNMNNYWDDLNEALNSCHIVHLLPPDVMFANVDDRTNRFVDAYNSKVDYWEMSNITKMTYNENILSKGKAKFPFSFEKIFDLYNKYDLFINFSLVKTTIKYWENPDFNTIIKNFKNTVSVKIKDNSYIEIPLNSNESCNVFVLSFQGMNGIIAFTRPFTLLYMKNSINTDNKLTVID